MPQYALHGYSGPKWHRGCIGVKKQRMQPSEDLERELSALSTLAEAFAKSHHLSFDEVARLLLEKHEKRTPALIPSSVFTDPRLGILQATIKYLREEFKLGFHQIAQLLSRDDRSIWTAYSIAQKKHPAALLVSEPYAWIPVSVLAQTHLGPLEAITIYLRDEVKMTFNEIAKLLKRDNRVIWAVYHKGRSKGTSQNGGDGQ